MLRDIKATAVFKSKRSCWNKTHTKSVNLASMSTVPYSLSVDTFAMFVIYLKKQ